jgi:hypothetical protein
MSKARDDFEGMYDEGLLFSEADVPAGYEPIGGLNNTNKPLHSFVLRACEKGSVRRYRVRQGQRGYGKYFICSDDLARVTKEWESLPKHTPEKHAADDLSDLKELTASCAAFVRHHLQVEQPGIFDCLNDAASCLCRIEKVLERLTTAVESIATQPTNANARDRLVATVESNGLHN